MTVAGESSFDEFLNFDPLLAAERLTGKSCGEDEDTMAVGMALLMEHGRQKREELGLRGDSYWGMDYDSYLDLVESLEFELLATEHFGEGETQHYYWLRGVLLCCNSHRGSINSSTLYFNWEINSDSSPWDYKLSGHLNRRFYDEDRRVWVGTVDGREALAHTLQRLMDAGTFLEEWVEPPHLWLLNYLEERSKTPSDLATMMKVALFPVEVQRAMGLEAGRDPA